eukprot:Rmarinus@m.19401
MDGSGRRPVLPSSQIPVLPTMQQGAGLGIVRPGLPQGQALQRNTAHANIRGRVGVLGSQKAPVGQKKAPKNDDSGFSNDIFSSLMINLNEEQKRLETVLMGDEDDEFVCDEKEKAFMKIDPLLDHIRRLAVSQGLSAVREDCSYLLSIGAQFRCHELVKAMMLASKSRKGKMSDSGTYEIDMKDAMFVLARDPLLEKGTSVIREDIRAAISAHQQTLLEPRPPPTLNSTTGTGAGAGSGGNTTTAQFSTAGGIPIGGDGPSERDSVLDELFG